MKSQPLAPQTLHVYFINIGWWRID